jgi:hypothetical protein
VYVPFSILNDSPVLGPRKPARARLSLLFLIKHANNAGDVTTVGHFWNAPYSEITVCGLRCQHLRLLFRGGSVPCKTCNRRWGSGSRKGVKDGE